MRAVVTRLINVDLQNQVFTCNVQIDASWREPELIKIAKVEGLGLTEKREKIEALQIEGLGLTDQLVCHTALKVEGHDHEPLFAGEHDIDQLGRVISVLGTPREDTWPEVVSLPDFGKISFPDTAPLPWEDVLTGPEALPVAQTLCSSLLSLNPAHRPSAADALRAQYFLCQPAPDVRIEMHTVL